MTDTMKSGYSYQQVLDLATAASIAVLALNVFILISIECSIVWVAGLGTIVTLSTLTATTCLYLKKQEPCDSFKWRGFITSVFVKLFAITIARYALWDMRRAYKSRSAMRAMQEKTLMRLVKQSRDTVFGRDHKFSDIQGIDDYRALVPVRDYADLEKYNQLAYKGEPNVFYKGSVDYLAKTSGTTGKNKTFPVSKRYKMSQIFNFLCTLRCYDEFIVKLGRQSKMLRQILLAVTPEDKQNEFGVQLGPVSKFFFTPGDMYTTPDEAFTKVHDSATGFYIHAVFALWHERIGVVNSFFPTTLITFMRCLGTNWDSVLMDIENGRLSADKVDVDADLFKLLNERLSPKPDRAAKLRALFGDGQDLSGFFEKAWPDVPCVMLARSGSFQASYRYLRKYLGNIPAFSPCILGTEGLVGINLSVVGNDEPDRYHPFLTGSFYEFIPVDAMGNDLGEPKLAHELQVGCMYETVATSYNCFRLRVGDVLCVVKMDGRAPVFEISHRKSHVLSVHVEKTTEKSLQACVMLTAERLGTQVVEFTAADCYLYEPVAGESLGIKYYAMFVELDGDKRLTDDEKLMFDKALRDSCENYDLFRGERHIDAMLVVQVRTGAFVALRQEMMKLNKDISEVQFKMPRVIKNTEQVKVLLEQKL